MYKPRGKPFYSWNRAPVPNDQELTSSIQIKALNTKDYLRKFQFKNPLKPSEETLRRRVHFEEFRETYQQRFQKSQEKSNALKLQMVTNINKWMEDQAPDDTYDMEFVNPVRIRHRRGVRTEKQPVMLRAPLRTIKTVKVEVPTWTTQAVVTPPPKLSTADSLIEKLKKLEQAKSCTAGVNEEGVQVDLMKELTDTRAEIDVASTQLRKIQTLLDERRILASIQEDEPVNIPKQPERMKTKWSITHSVSKQKAGRNKLLDALKTVNNRLQRMQDQYFSNPHHKYKSLKQVTNNLADVDIIYKNKKFASPAHNDSSVIVANEKSSKEISPVIKKYILQTLFQDDPRSTATTGVGPDTPRKLYSPRRMRSPRKPSPPKILEESESIVEVIPESSSVNVILPPPLSPKKPVIKEEPAKSTKSKDGEGDSFLETLPLSSCLKDSIAKSNFLMKEFNVSQSDYLKASQKTRRHSGKKKTVHFSFSKIDERPNSNNETNKKRLQDAFEHALKHTLYTT